MDHKNNTSVFIFLKINIQLTIILMVWMWLGLFSGSVLSMFLAAVVRLVKVPVGGGGGQRS